MTPHAELLQLIGEVSAVPTDDVGWTLDVDEDGGPFWQGPDDVPYANRGCLTHDAHAHIENAAWRVVREWCKKFGMYTRAFDHQDGNVYIGCDDAELGSGPDDVTALIAAVRYIKENSK